MSKALHGYCSDNAAESRKSCHAGAEPDQATGREQQQKKKQAAAEKWGAQLRLFQLAAIDQTERLWQVKLMMSTLLVTISVSSM